MELSVLINLDPRNPEFTVYTEGRFDFTGRPYRSVEMCCSIKHHKHKRIGSKKLPFNASVRLAKLLYDGILVYAEKSEKDSTLQGKYVSKDTSQMNSVLLKVGDESSDKVLNFIYNFVKVNNLSQNGTNTTADEQPTFSTFISGLTIA